MLPDNSRVIRPQRLAFDGCAGTIYAIRPSCLRALDGDQSRGFGASAVTRLGIGWAPEVFLPVADRPRGTIHLIISERLVINRAPPCLDSEPSIRDSDTPLRFLSARADVSRCAFRDNRIS